jgi:hemolysin III
MKSKQKTSDFIKNKVLKKEFKGFSKGEEIFNAVSHIAGGAFAIAVTVIGIVTAITCNDAWAVVAMAIYGGSMILVYTSSSIYHFLRRNRAKKVFRILDHCMIFLLIAGTYTPFCLVALRGGWGWSLFGILWTITVLGITLKAIALHDKPTSRWVG